MVRIEFKTFLGKNMAGSKVHQTAQLSETFVCRFYTFAMKPGTKTVRVHRACHPQSKESSTIMLPAARFAGSIHAINAVAGLFLVQTMIMMPAYR